MGIEPEGATVDLRLEYSGGSVALLVPETALAWAWVSEHLHFEEWQRVGDAVAVEPALTEYLLAAAEGAGLVVEPTPDDRAL